MGLMRFLQHAFHIFKEKGLFLFFKTGLRFAWSNSVDRAHASVRRLFPAKTFIWQGSRCKYFIHFYNRTWQNERAVEVPITLREINNNRGKRILEVGDVLNHYHKFYHDVLDKYTVGRGIINEDVVDFSPKVLYDLIVSISTIEHVGWDEVIREPDKTVRAIAQLKKFLAPGGRLMATIPLGYNQDIDRLLEKCRFPFDKIIFLKRISKRNEWKEVFYEEARETHYGEPFPVANALAVGYLSWKNGENNESVEFFNPKI